MEAIKKLFDLRWVCRFPHASGQCSPTTGGYPNHYGWGCGHRYVAFILPDDFDRLFEANDGGSTS